MKQPKNFEHISIAKLFDSFATGSLVSYTDACGLFLCQNGSAEISINSQIVNITRGDIFIYVPSAYVYVIRRSDDLQGITYKTSMDFILSLSETSINIKLLLLLSERPYFHITEEQQKRMEALMSVIDSRQALLDEPTDNRETLPLLQKELNTLGEALLQEVCYCYATTQTAGLSEHSKKERIVHTFILSLMEHFKQEREVAYYAHLQCLHPRYFSSVIKEHTGRTAQQWIISIVMNSIKQTLLYSGKSVKEIALEYNFPTQSFFGKYFKQYAGTSPHAFRKHILDGKQ